MTSAEVCSIADSNSKTRQELLSEVAGRALSLHSNDLFLLHFSSAIQHLILLLLLNLFMDIKFMIAFA